MKAIQKNQLYRKFGVKNVVCSGAGIVGQSFAQALSHHNYFKECEDGNIVILDMREPPALNNFAEKGIPNQRTYTLSPVSLKFLNNLGTLNILNWERFQEYYSMQVWEKQGTSYLKFDAGEADTKWGMGRTIENDHLSAALYLQLKENPKVEFIFGDTVKKYHKDGHILQIELESGRELETHLLVGSDGNNSAVKKLSGIQTRGWSHNQKAIVCTVRTTKPNGQLWQRFLQTGPLAVLNMWDNYSSIVWSVPDTLFDHLISIKEEEFVIELNRALHSESDTQTGILGNYIGPNTKEFPPKIEEICNQRLSFPLSTLSAESYCLDNIALIGDAAHSIHPMAGQGLNLGLLDSSILANVICKALNEGREFSSENSLYEYEWRAKANNYSMQAGLEAIKTMYSLDSLPINWARNFGVEMIQNTPLKGIFQKVASGELYQDNEVFWKN